MSLQYIKFVIGLLLARCTQAVMLTCSADGLLTTPMLSIVQRCAAPTSHGTLACDRGQVHDADRVDDEHGNAVQAIREYWRRERKTNPAMNTIVRTMPEAVR